MEWLIVPEMISHLYTQSLSFSKITFGSNLVISESISQLSFQFTYLDARTTPLIDEGYDDDESNISILHLLIPKIFCDNGWRPSNTIPHPDQCNSLSQSTQKAVVSARF